MVSVNRKYGISKVHKMSRKYIHSLDNVYIYHKNRTNVNVTKKVLILMTHITSFSHDKMNLKLFSKSGKTIFSEVTTVTTDNRS